MFLIVCITHLHAVIKTVFLSLSVSAAAGRGEAREPRSGERGVASIMEGVTEKHEGRTAKVFRIAIT